jgi:site-specific DNA-methyltransferase (adenine-specific)
MNVWDVITGDSNKVMPTLPAECARLIFADGPYNLAIDYGNGRKADRLSREPYLRRSRAWMLGAKRLLTIDGSLWVLINDEWAGDFQCLLRGIGLHWRETIVFHETFGVYCKNRFGKDHRPLFRFTRDPKRQIFHPERVESGRQKCGDKRADHRGRIPSNVWTISRVCGTFNERLPDFPTQLPVELLRRVITTGSDPGDLVVDPFSGSATTGVAAVELGRRYLGIELNPVYAELSRERLRGVRPVDFEDMIRDLPNDLLLA